MHRLLIVLLAVAVLGTHRALCGELSIAAASDLVFCLEELNRAFGKANPEIRTKATTTRS